MPEPGPQPARPEGAIGAPESFNVKSLLIAVSGASAFNLNAPKSVMMAAVAAPG
jgi:hypothetical protein